MTPRTAKPGRPPGFTLIELVLAIGISAIVLVAINGAFFGALRLRAATVESVDAAVPVDQALTTLRRDLQCAVSPKASGLMSGSFKTGSVIGNGIAQPVQLEFHTATAVFSRNEPWGEVQRVAYSLKGTANQRDLYRCVTRNLLTLATPQVEEQLVLRGVDQFQVLCFDGSRWTETWDTSDTASLSTNLPLAVRLQIRRSGSAPQSSPIEVVVPIRTVTRDVSNTAQGGT